MSKSRIEIGVSNKPSEITEDKITDPEIEVTALIQSQAILAAAQRLTEQITRAGEVITDMILAEVQKRLEEQTRWTITEPTKICYSLLISDPAPNPNEVAIPIADEWTITEPTEIIYARKSTEK